METDYTAVEDAVNNELAHYGIRGMRWGVRRRTGPDGLVDKTASEEAQTSESKSASHPQSADHERAAKAFAKSQEKGIQSLSNEEINAITKRVEAEKKFNQLSGEQKSKLQKELDDLKLRDELRKYRSKEAEARRGTGRRMVDSLLSAGMKAASDAAAEYGASMAKDMLGLNKPKPKTKDELLKEQNDSLRLIKENRQLKKDLHGLGYRPTTANGGTQFKVNPSKVKIGPNGTTVNRVP